MKLLFTLLFSSTLCFGMNKFKLISTSHPEPPEWSSGDEIGDPRSLSSSGELKLSEGEQELFDALKQGEGSARPDASKQNMSTIETRLRAQQMRCVISEVDKKFQNQGK